MSSGILIATLCALVALLIRYLVTEINKWRQLPRGPFGVPILGYIPFLARDQHLQMMELKKKYGSVFTINLGGLPAVFVNDWKTAKQTLGSDDILMRPESHMIYPFRDGKTPTYLEDSGPNWREQRRFSLHTLRDLGVGKNVMEERIMNQILEYLDLIKQHEGETYHIRDGLMSSISNVISEFVLGYGLNKNDPRRVQLDRAIALTSEELQFAGFAVVYPKLTRILSRLPFGNFRRLRNYITDVYNFVSAEVDSRKSFGENNNEDFIDSFLGKIQSETKAKVVNSSYHLESLKENARILFVAGSETTTTSLTWILLMLAKYPDVQKKVIQEIDAVIGRDSMPTWARRLQMPYTQAVIMECARWKPIVPINLPRRTFSEVVIGGHKIPANTIVFVNIWAVCHDPKVWTHPEKFDPTRFLDGDTIVRNEALIPFSYGKRSCPGEILAKYEIFLYMTSILQKYELKPPLGGEISLQSSLGSTLTAKRPLLTFVRR